VLDDATVARLPEKYHVGGVKQYLEFSREMNGAVLSLPNHLRGVMVRSLPLRVREIFGIVQPTPTEWTPESAAELIADRLPEGMVPVAMTSSGDFYLLDQYGHLRVLQHDVWEGDDEVPEVAEDFASFVEAIEPGALSATGSTCVVLPIRPSPEFSSGVRPTVLPTRSVRRRAYTGGDASKRTRAY
jgi:hypothetical protein